MTPDQPLDGELAAGAVDRLAHRLVHHHQLVDAGPAAIAGVVALLAAHRTPDLLIRRKLDAHGNRRSCSVTGVRCAAIRQRVRTSRWASTARRTRRAGRAQSPCPAFRVMAPMAVLVCRVDITR